MVKRSKHEPPPPPPLFDAPSESDPFPVGEEESISPPEPVLFDEPSPPEPAPEPMLAEPESFLPPPVVPEPAPAPASAAAVLPAARQGAVLGKAKARREELAALAEKCKDGSPEALVTKISDIDVAIINCHADANDGVALSRLEALIG